MLIRFTQAARRHRIGRGPIRYVMATAVPFVTTTTTGVEAYAWIGRDDRNRKLTIIALIGTNPATGEAALVVIHVQPEYR